MRAATVTKTTHATVSICNDKTLPLERQPDGEGFYIHCVGGFRAADYGDGRWLIEPLLDNGHPCRKGFFAKNRLETFIRDTGLTAIALQRFGWREGHYYSSWAPIVPGRQNHMLGPSDLWINISSNLATKRSGISPIADAFPTRETIAAMRDDRSDEEWLALSLGLSLRSMDISVEQISEFYNEQLADLISAGLTDGRQSGRAGDQALFSHVHSFFLHLGAARDYLAALIAIRLGKSPQKVDSMTRLVEVLRARHFGTDSLLDLMKVKKFIEPNSEKPNRYAVSGWLKEASDLRNQLVHRRPYGARHVEQFGHLVPIAAEAGLYRYVRPILIEENSERDAIDVVVAHYRQSTGFFMDMAEASGWDVSMMRLTDADIRSATLRNP